MNNKENLIKFLKILLGTYLGIGLLISIKQCFSIRFKS